MEEKGQRFPKKAGRGLEEYKKKKRKKIFLKSYFFF